MGQYYKGSKIGTCETMYYMRLEEAKDLALQGAKDDDGIGFDDYVLDNTTRFRFPFPNEDGWTHIALVGKDDFAPTFELPAQRLKINHQDICVSNSFKKGGSNVNILLPCPHSEEFKKSGIKMSNGGAGMQYVSVKYQAIRDEKEKTIFECPRCHQEQRFDDDTVEEIKKQSLEHFECYNMKGKNPSYGGNQGLYDYAMEIIKRIK